MTYYTYILSGQNYGPIFIEAVENISPRIAQHKRGRLSVDAFRIDRLVYVEKHESLHAAQMRVKALKSASREWVDALIERRNPDWTDLAAMTVRNRKIAA